MAEQDQSFSMSERDLLIRLDAKMNAMANDIKTLVTNQDGFDTRLRGVETAVTILSPTPGSPSHAQLVADSSANRILIDSNAKRVSTLESALQKYVPDYIIKVDKQEKDIQDLQDNRAFILGGWKMSLILIGGVAWLIGISIAVIEISLRLPIH